MCVQGAIKGGGRREKRGESVGGGGGGGAAFDLPSPLCCRNWIGPLYCLMLASMNHSEVGKSHTHTQTHTHTLIHTIVSFRTCRGHCARDFSSWLLCNFHGAPGPAGVGTAGSGRVRLLQEGEGWKEVFLNSHGKGKKKKWHSGSGLHFCCSSYNIFCSNL